MPTCGGRKALLEDTGGVPVNGIGRRHSRSARATCGRFRSCGRKVRYSSSINPIRHDLYGMPDAPRVPFQPGSRRRDGDSHDDGAPVGPQLAVLRRRLFPPAADGALPSRAGAGEPARRQPGIFYFHPWEIDPDQPRIPERRLEVAAAALHQPVAHGGRPGRAAAGFRLGPDGPGLCAGRSPKPSAA